MQHHLWEIILLIFGLILSGLGTLIVWNLRSIIHRLDSQDKKVDYLEKAFLTCKHNCLQTFVDKEDWLREAGNNRQTLGEVTNTLSRMEGKMGVMEQLPAICGNIAREIAREMKGH